MSFTRVEQGVFVDVPSSRNPFFPPWESVRHGGGRFTGVRLAADVRQPKVKNSKEI